MNKDGGKIRARARLALRAERAFGLSSIPGNAAELPQPQSAEQPALQNAPAQNPPRAAQQAVKASFASPPARAADAPRIAISSAAPKELLGQSRATPAAASPAAAATTLRTTEPFTASPLSRTEKMAQLKALDDNEVRGCTQCRLCETRTNTVFGEGDADARLLFIGEGPGENEDLQGRPFVGRAGELLNKWIIAMGLAREQVFIANIVKCRPPENREPAPDEIATCTPYLVRQIEIIRPQVIMTLGRPSSQYMLQTKESMGKMRGRWFEYRGIKLMPTYHPAYVLRNYTYETRAAVWDDLKHVMSELALPVSPRSARS